MVGTIIVIILGSILLHITVYAQFALHLNTVVLNMYNRFCCVEEDIVIIEVGTSTVYPFRKGDLKQLMLGNLFRKLWKFMLETFNQ